MPIVIIARMNAADRLLEAAWRRLRKQSVACAVLVAGVALMAAGLVRAVDDVGLAIERIDGEGWKAEGVEIDLFLPGRATEAAMTISRLELLSTAYELRDLRIACPDLELSIEAIACAAARIEVQAPELGAQALTGHLVYHRRSGALDMQLDGWQFAQGTASLRAALSEDGWQAEVKLDGAAIEPLLGLANAAGVTLPEFSASGIVSLDLDVQGVDASIRRARFEASIAELAANNQAGSIASDMLAMTVQGTVARNAGDWAFDATVRSSQGQAYVEPVFVDFARHGIELGMRGIWAPEALGTRGVRETPETPETPGTAGGTLVLDRFDVHHRDVARARGSASLDFAHDQPVRELALELDGLEFPGAYTSYFQPLLLDTDFKSLDTAGRLAGRLAIVAGVPSRIDLEFHGLTLDDGAGSFGLTGLDGEWHWRSAALAAGEEEESAEFLRNPDGVPESHLEWSNGALLGLELGASGLRFTTVERRFRLLEPAHIPVFDGAIDLESFRIRNVGMPSVAFIVDATIRPISVQLLSRAFGWPEFGGSVAGAISELRMRDGLLTLGTTLRAQVFDGEVTISDLRLEQPFGQWPRFYSNIALENLDLELVTGAFEFGRITGRLSGAIDGLELFNWTPVAFDARLYTPPGDRSRRRISQRAVQNIGSIGGGGAGVTAALSSGFLRFFDDFNYDRLGISCRLETDICHMNGVAPAPNGGYYLVRGRGLPRINVIGNARRVDWPRLVQQLVTVTQSEGPVVR